MIGYATQCINCGHVDQPAVGNCSACRSTELHGFPVEVGEDAGDVVEVGLDRLLDDVLARLAGVEENV